MSVAVSGSDIPVHAMDGTTVVLKITPTTLASASCIVLREQLHIDYDPDYCMYEYCDGFFRCIDDDIVLSRVIQRWPQKDFDAGSKKLYYKRRVYVPESATEQRELAAEDSEDTLHRLAFHDAVYHYLHGNYRFAARNVILLAGLLLQSGRGDYVSTRDTEERIREYLPHLVPGYSVIGADSTQFQGPPLGQSAEALEVPAIVTSIIEQFSSLHGMSQFEAQQTFIKTCKEFSAYGSDFFRGKRTWKENSEGDAEVGKKVKSRTEDVMIAVSYEGLHLLSIDDPMHLESHEFETITKWTVSRDGKIFAFSVDDDVIVYLVTEQAGAIEKAVERYVQELVAVRGGNTRPPRESTGSLPEFVELQARQQPPYVLDQSEIHVAADGHAAVENAPAAQSEEEQEQQSEANDSDANSQQSRDGLPEGWVALTDEDGDTYYFNEGTGETSWTLPGTAADDESSLPAGWERVVDEDGDVYYHNTETGETTWDHPSAEEANDSDNEDAALPDGWERIVDEDGDVYYYNSETGETSWDPPSN